MVSSPIYSYIKNKRSIRKYLQKVVSRNRLKRSLKVAIWVPSAHNSQYRNFIVIQDDGIKQKPSEMMVK